MPSETSSRGLGSTFTVAVIAAIVGGVILALVLPHINSPDLKILYPDLQGNTTAWEDLTLTVAIHNDGSASAGNCIAPLGR